MPIIVRCPICSSTEVTSLYSVDSVQAAQHVVGRDVDPQRLQQLKLHIESLWHDYTCAFISCDNCSFGFAQPYIAADKRFYELVYNDSVYPRWKWEYQMTLGVLRDLSMCDSPSELNLLEVGAGDGAFVEKIISDRIRKEHVLCSEYSDYGKSKIDSLGITCIQEDIRSPSFEKYIHHFDIVCLFQVLEHLNDLDTFFERLTRLTKSQAHMFIAVPNTKHREFFDRHGFLEDIPPTHIGRWSILSLSIMAKRYDWKLVGYKTEPQSYASKATKFIFFKYESFRHTAWINRIRHRSIRKMAKLILMSWCMLTSLPSLFALRSPALGVSQWFHLQKDGFEYDR